MSKRTLDAFFSRRESNVASTSNSPPTGRPKRQRLDDANSVGDAGSELRKKQWIDASPLEPAITAPSEDFGDSELIESSKHPAYPCHVSYLPLSISSELELLVTSQGRSIADSTRKLDLLYFQPFVPTSTSRELFRFLRSELPFYRVQYNINRFGKDTVVNTPRYTTVFGVDETSIFADDDLIDKQTKVPVRKDKYRCTPRPIPQCLNLLRLVTEAATNTNYNFCLVNYYASGSDSISFHSDDERFLGTDPAIASFSLGATRDFLMKPKSPSTSSASAVADKDVKKGDSTMKLPLASGDMVLMRGPTQANWLHSIPKRKGGEADRGRINITFRRAMVREGTENYYRYNVGGGEVFRWNAAKKEMAPLLKQI